MQLFEEPVLDKRQRFLQAAWDLAAKRGYSAITMRHIAAEAGLGKSTLYRMYTTKEQLFRDVTRAWARQFAKRLQAKPVRGKTAGERLCEINKQVMLEAERHPKLITAYLASLLSDTVDDRNGRADMRDQTARLVAFALGDELRSKNQVIAELTLGHMLLSSMQLMAAGLLDRTRAVREINRAAKIMFSDIWDV